ncbi:MAG TPA: sn-glycerol-3-phosphate ABC transporter ATP-binding protein UgpC [Acidimicrobiales bacterium]|nr:sn-glycerol-3-phosphate ABC transporter ATP-binding protein UgpC [Acidimicrobiales bacterium]
MAEITLEGLGKVYPDGTRAVGNVNLEIEDGEFLVLVGPSGCGKSTILRMIAGLEEITEGKLLIGGQVMNDVQPKDRDIAMVFQSYALYPHMSVYDNMAFALKLRKVPKDEIRQRVERAAEILEITSLLDRKPKTLSGGQRQRVAMGRAIVREPKAFLMDEPLSNLDAKLRVQMRAQLSELHKRLGTTTVYVTHDQVEAMTLGHRVAVLKPVSEVRPTNLQQVAPPAELYQNPANLFVASFIGSPAMNLAYCSLTSENGKLFAEFAGYRVEVDARAIERHPGIEKWVGHEVVIGIRPGEFEAAAIMPPRPDRQITVKIELAEILGSETFIHFEVNSRPVLTPEIRELLDRDQAIYDEHAETSKFTARVSPDVVVHAGDTIDLQVDTAKIHFFDPENGLRIVEQSPTGQEPEASA